MIPFYKYHGAGNDFIMIDNRNLTFNKDKTLIADMCHRRFGVGADGLILLENDLITDFKMIYYNSDGNQSTMCGNGGRCIVQFAFDLGIINKKTVFTAIDGEHFAKVCEDTIVLQMIDISEVNIYKDNSVFVYSGSPHHIECVNDIDQLNIVEWGRGIRNSERYAPDGVNVNAVQVFDDCVKLRTYERGVEDETLACGTGATAVAIALHKTKKNNSNALEIQVKGGKLKVTFEEEKGIYKNVFLEGNAQFIFEGKWK